MNSESNTQYENQRKDICQIESLDRYPTQEYQHWHDLLRAQPTKIRSDLEAEAHNLAQILSQPHSQIRFTLPDSVITQAGGRHGIPVPDEYREQLIGGLMDRMNHTGLNTALRERLDELEVSPNKAVSTASSLLRFAIAFFMVHDLLPAGHSVHYLMAKGAELPSLPDTRDGLAEPKYTAEANIALSNYEISQENGIGEIDPTAGHFYFPQWVAFDGEGKLLVDTASKAEDQLTSMQHYVKVLHMVIGLAPFMVADDQYRQKRSGMLGQLVNQGRAMARYLTSEIIVTIKRRAAANDLNRGLSISLPYFDDQNLEIKIHAFNVIPTGRIMFISAFVVLAVHKEQVKVAQDTRLNRSTRQHLLSELRMLEISFS
jgi:hypothetical protein